MNSLYIDIETLPTNRADIEAEIRASVRPPAQYKKPESIEAWMKSEGVEAGEEAFRRTALDGSFGRVCVVGFALDEEPVECLYGLDERELLEKVLLQFEVLTANRFTTCVVGHNVSGFDLRFLVQRFIVHGMRPPIAIARAAQAKPWETEKVYDTMVQWAGVGNRISLDRLCKALSIESPKGDLDGSKVYDYVKAGRIVEVSDYCAKDVEAVRKVHRRMTFA